MHHSVSLEGINGRMNEWMNEALFINSCSSFRESVNIEGKEDDKESLLTKIFNKYLVGNIQIAYGRSWWGKKKDSHLFCTLYVSKILEPENQKDNKGQLSFSWLLWPGNTLVTTDQGFPWGPAVSAEPQLERLQIDCGEPEGHGHFVVWKDHRGSVSHGQDLDFSFF